MASQSEQEFYRTLIDGRGEPPAEVDLWQEVRLPFPGKPRFLGVLRSPQYRLYCVVSLGLYMGEGNVTIPLGLYSDEPHQVDAAIVTHNRLQLNYTDQRLDQIAARLDIPWGYTYQGIECTSAGGHEIFYTPGYELYLKRSLSFLKPKTPLVILPNNDMFLHALSAYGLTQAISTALEHISIQPLEPQELQLSQSAS